MVHVNGCTLNCIIVDSVKTFLEAFFSINISIKLNIFIEKSLGQ